MAEKTFQSRIKHKRDTAANWEKVATSFQPLDGELVIVDTAAGATRFKVGRYDSSKGRLLFYNEIPFTDEFLYSDMTTKVGNLNEIISGKVDSTTFNSALDDKADKSHDHQGTYSAVQFVRW